MWPQLCPHLCCGWHHNLQHVRRPNRGFARYLIDSRHRRMTRTSRLTRWVRKGRRWYLHPQPSGRGHQVNTNMSLTIHLMECRSRFILPGFDCSWPASCILPVAGQAGDCFHPHAQACCACFQYPLIQGTATIYMRWQCDLSACYHHKHNPEKVTVCMPMTHASFACDQYKHHQEKTTTRIASFLGCPKFAFCAITSQRRSPPELPSSVCQCNAGLGCVARWCLLPVLLPGSQFSEERVACMNFARARHELNCPRQRCPCLSDTSEAARQPPHPFEHGASQQQQHQPEHKAPGHNNRGCASSTISNLPIAPAHMSMPIATDTTSVAQPPPPQQLLQQQRRRRWRRHHQPPQPWSAVQTCFFVQDTRLSKQGAHSSAHPQPRL